MAVTMKIGKNLYYKIAEAVGLSNNTALNLSQALFDDSALIEMNAQGHVLTALIQNELGMSPTTVGVSLPVSVMSVCMGQSLADDIKSICQTRLLSFSAQVVKVYAGLSAPVLPKASVAAPSSGGYPMPLTLKELDNMAPVPLREAQYLLQRVKSTSVVYRAIAISPDLKVAALVRNHKVSIRFEGNISPAVKVKLIDLGFTNNGSYLSAHLYTEGDMSMAQRLVGAALFATAHPFDAVFTDLSKIPENENA